MPASKYKIQRKCKVCGTLFYAKTVSFYIIQFIQQKLHGKVPGA